MGRTIGKVHTSLEADGEVLGSPGVRILFVKPKLKVLQPLDLLVAVVLCTLWGDDILDQYTTILVKLVAPVTVDLILVESDQVFGFEAGGNCALLGLGGGGHDDDLGLQNKDDICVPIF